VLNSVREIGFVVAEADGIWRMAAILQDPYKFETPDKSTSVSFACLSLRQKSPGKRQKDCSSYVIHFSWDMLRLVSLHSRFLPKISSTNSGVRIETTQKNCDLCRKKSESAHPVQCCLGFTFSSNGVNGNETNDNRGSWRQNDEVTLASRYRLYTWIL
jgi:hypothetical protein